MQATTVPTPAVNGIAIAGPDEALAPDTLHQRAHVELLRQAAIAAGLLDADDPVPQRGVLSQAASDAIEALLDRELQALEPGDEACRRFHAANAARYAVGERIRMRHVLFAVTPGVDVVALRQRAEACLIDLRARTPEEADRFATAAAALSNCPSAAAGGDLGWLTSQDCAPELAPELFGRPEVGVLPRLVHSRFGLHVVEVIAREPGTVPPYDAVKASVRLTLERQAFANALRHFLQQLAERARIDGVALAASTPTAP